MRKPKDPRSALAMTYFLKKPRPIAYVSGGMLVAPKGMACVVISVAGKCPRVRFREGLWSEIGYEVKWSDISPEEPRCSKCGQETDPKSFILKPKKK